jgi:ABC-2 type transport system permease protein
MIGSFRAEWRKLRQRPAVLVLLALLVLGVVVTLYLVPYFRDAQAGFTDSRSGVPGSILKLGLYPPQFIHVAVQIMIPDGMLLALLVGTLGLGSEYGWGTLKTVLVQRSGRVRGTLGRMSATAGVLLILVLVSYGTAAAASVVAAVADGKGISWPAVQTVAEVLGASWLVLMCYALTGMLLAAILRNAALAIGIGIFYMVIFESAFLDLFRPLWRSGIDALETIVPGVNSAALLTSFGPPPGETFPTPVVDATHGAILLVMWIVGLATLTTALLWRRDVT